jgi:hypothetical protein
VETGAVDEYPLVPHPIPPHVPRAASAVVASAALAASIALGAFPAAVMASSDPDATLPVVERPVVAVDALSVEQGVLTLRWTETANPAEVDLAAIATSGLQGLPSTEFAPSTIGAEGIDGPDGLYRTIRVETAPTTPSGCGDFQAIGGIPLGEGAYDHGTVSLGAPPSEGCLRATLAVTDGFGVVTLTSSLPYRVGPVPVAAAASPVAPKRWSGRFNLFRSNAFVTQKTFKWCVAASVQMMVNLVRNHSDRTAKTQRKVITYAQQWDNGPYGEDGGTDTTGWIRALQHFGAGKYRAVGATTPERALRIAATAMRQTGRPAGIMVMEGRHAWVLHGFESRTDPQRDRRANVRAVRISGPLYPVQQANGYDPKPNTRLTTKALEKFFLPTIVGEQAGQYVVIVPSH